MAMKDQYIKDVENQNYDLMKKLAEVQELLEDHNKRLEHNEKLTESLIIDLISNIWHKVKTLHVYKTLLEENGIDHNMIQPTEQDHKDSEKVANSFIHNYFEAWNGRIDNVVSSHSYKIYSKYVKPHIKTDKYEEDIDNECI